MFKKVFRGSEYGVSKKPCGPTCAVSAIALLFVMAF